MNSNWIDQKNKQRRSMKKELYTLCNLFLWSLCEIYGNLLNVIWIFVTLLLLFTSIAFENWSQSHTLVRLNGINVWNGWMNEYFLFGNVLDSFYFWWRLIVCCVQRGFCVMALWYLTHVHVLLSWYNFTLEKWKFIYLWDYIWCDFRYVCIC